MKLLLLATLVYIPVIGLSQFRDSEWGMSKGLVRQSEKEKFPEITNTVGREVLYYPNRKLGTYDVSIIYVFTDDKLIGGGYYISEEYLNENNYILSYKDLKAQLTSKYGLPISSDDMIWKGSTYKDMPDRFGFAVSAGQLEYMSTWHTSENTYITLSLNGENFECSLSIQYNEKRYIDNLSLEPAEGL